MDSKICVIEYMIDTILYYNTNQLKNKESFIDCLCSFCKKEFRRKRALLSISLSRSSKLFCSQKCLHQSHRQDIKISCKNCGIEILRSQSELSKNNFCSRSCAATFNNTHKTKGTRCSKLEKWLEEKLSETYDFKIDFSNKSAINSELDIYIPSLNLAFEINGIFHYRPIYGELKLLKIKANDSKKLAACELSGIKLYVIDVSRQKYFKESTSLFYLAEINRIIDRFLQKKDCAAES